MAGYACGVCDHCVSGWETLCLEQKNMGYSIDESFKDSLAYSDRVGPLSGKTIWAVVAFLVSRAGLHAALRRRDVNLRSVWLITLALLALGLLGTFSPFFEPFAPPDR